MSRVELARVDSIRKYCESGRMNRDRKLVKKASRPGLGVEVRVCVKMVKLAKRTSK